MGKFLSIPKAAQEYGLSIPTLKKKIEAGELSAMKFGPKAIRVSVDEIKKKFRFKPQSSAKVKNQKG